MDKYLDGVQNVLAVVGATAPLWAPLLYKLWPKGARVTMDLLAKIPPNFKSELEDRLGSIDARKATAKELAWKIAKSKKYKVTEEQVDALVDLVAPLAKKLKVKVK